MLTSVAIFYVSYGENNKIDSMYIEEQYYAQLEECDGNGSDFLDILEGPCQLLL